jgi:hypothetical protein
MSRRKYEKHHCMLRGVMSAAVEAASKVNKDSRENGYEGPMDPQIAAFLKNSLRSLEELLDSWS